MLGDTRYGETAFGIVGGVVEESKTRTVALLEIENVESGRALVEIVAVTPGIKPEQGTYQQPNRRFVRDNNDGFSGASADDLQQGGQGPGRHRQAALAPSRRERIGIVLPGGKFIGVFGFHIRSFQPFPMSVRHFAKLRACLDGKLVRLRQQTSGFGATLKGRRADGSDRLGTEPGGQSARLLTSIVRKRDIGFPGETIFRGESG